MAGDDGFIGFNHIDELTYPIRSNMGAEGIIGLEPGTIMIGRIVPVADDWMISGPAVRIPADEADTILQSVPDLVMSHPKAVFRNPIKLAQARELQAEQRANFIEQFGSDLIVIPGFEVTETLIESYRYSYEKAGSTAGPWTDPGLPPLPPEWTEADSVALIYDEEDGLGFYVDYALAQEAFDDPALIVRRRYREVVSGYLRDEAVSPIPLRRLAAADPEKASRLFEKLLKKRGFSWDRDGESLLRRYKQDWYDEPHLPCVTLVSDRLAAQFRANKAQG